MPHQNDARDVYETVLLFRAWLRGEPSPLKDSPLPAPPLDQVAGQNPAPVTDTPSTDPAAALEALRLSFADCTRCEIAARRHNLVFGQGHPSARLMLIGEGPGEQEDLRGIAFCGPSGELLTKMLAAISLVRDEVYIANVIKCRPPNNRNPLPEEVANCRGYLDAQIDIIRPQIIATLGSVAVKTLMGCTEGVTKLRGQTLEYRGIPVIPTFHPSFLLRDPSRKREAWEDLKRIRRLLDELAHAVR